jgi:molybdenum cofactor biosynthesis protein B
MTHPSNDSLALQCAVVTVSDTRTRETDRGGPLVIDRLIAARHAIAAYDIIPDDGPAIRSHVEALLARPCDAVILTGGTGIAPRDVTLEAVEPLLEKRLDGFGELFRMLSFEQIGPAAMLSRARAGTCGPCVVFVLPGSPKAVELAMDRLILPVLPHAAALLRP